MRITRIGLITAAMLAGGIGIAAAQTSTTTTAPNAGKCWDSVTKQVRNETPGTSGSASSSTSSSTSPSTSGSTSPNTVPAVWIEQTTYRLQGGCSTAELSRHARRR